MENKVIDVDYREVVDLNKLTTEQLADQANTIYMQAEAVAAVSMRLVAEAGKRLIVLKERIGHGSWEAWVEENLEFSKSKAEKMMKLAKKMGDENSLFSKAETFTDIGISKVWALLAAPEEVAAEVIADPEIESKTVRELKAEIQRIKRENEMLGQNSAAANELRDKAFKQASRIRELEKQLENVVPTDDLEKSLEDTKKKLEDTREKLRKEKAAAKALAEGASETAKKKAEEIAGEKIKEEAEKLKEKIEQVRKEEEQKRAKLEEDLEKARKMADSALMEFKLKVDILQNDFAGCLELIRAAGPDTAEKWAKAMRVVLQKMGEQI